MKCLSLLLIVAAPLLAAQVVATAASLRTFTISGLFRDGATMSGTMTIDDDR